MSFNKYRNLEQKSSVDSGFANSANQDMVDDYVEVKLEWWERISKEPFEYYYEDVISDKIGFSYKQFLDDEDYKGIKEDARECLEFCGQFKNLSSRIVLQWLSSSLKLIDYIVVHYLQEVKKITPKKYPKMGIERSRYYHLTELQEVKEAGNLLYAFYEDRNANEHRTKTDISTGKQTLIRPNRNKLRDRIVKDYPTILKNFKKIYLELATNNVN